MVWEIRRRKGRKQEEDDMFAYMILCVLIFICVECRGLKGERERMKRTAGGMGGGCV